MSITIHVVTIYVNNYTCGNYPEVLFWSLAFRIIEVVLYVLAD